MSWQNNIAILEYHASLVADVDRVDRYREAIHAVVQPGDVVVDIGTGTGLLAYFACQAGAARVYAIEQGPIIDLARELALLTASPTASSSSTTAPTASSCPSRPTC